MLRALAIPDAASVQVTRQRRHLMDTASALYNQPAYSMLHIPYVVGISSLQMACGADLQYNATGLAFPSTEWSPLAGRGLK